MESIKYKFNLDCNKVGIQKIIQGIQTGDVMSRSLEISLRAGSTPVEFPTSHTVTAMMYVVKPNTENPSINACEFDYDNSVIKYDITQEDIAVAGIVTMQVKVLGTDSKGATKVLVSPKFQIEIEESEVDDSEAEGTQTFTALEQALARANEVYESRLVSVITDEEHKIVVTYADGTVYKSDAIPEAVLEQYSEVSEVLEGLVTDASESASLATNKAEEASEEAEKARLSAEEAEANAQAIGDVLSEAAQIKNDTQAIKDSAIADVNLIKESAAFISNQNRLDSEAYALGTRDGVPVSEEDAAYNNNAKYWAQNASSVAKSEFVSFSTSQTLTDEQKNIARSNIGSASVEDLSKKANLVPTASGGNFAQLNKDGSYSNSGYKPSSFASASHGHVLSDINGLEKADLLFRGNIANEIFTESGYRIFMFDRGIYIAEVNVSNLYKRLYSLADFLGIKKSVYDKVEELFIKSISNSGILHIQLEVMPTIDGGYNATVNYVVTISACQLNPTSIAPMVLIGTIANLYEWQKAEEAYDFVWENTYTSDDDTYTDDATSVSVLLPSWQVVTFDGHTHTTNDITDFPTEMPPSAHNQSASTITTGTFGGDVSVPASTAYTSSLARNIVITTTDQTSGASTSYANGTIIAVRES